MTNFQTIGVGVAAILFIATIAASTGRAINRRAAIAWMALWVAAGVAIARPSITISVARLLGIGRGADLVFYCAILAMLIGFFVVYIRLKRLDRQITILVRNAALTSAKLEESEGPTSRQT